MSEHEMYLKMMHQDYLKNKQDLVDSLIDCKKEVRRIRKLIDRDIKKYKFVIYHVKLMRTRNVEPVLVLLKSSLNKYKDVRKKINAELKKNVELAEGKLNILQINIDVCYSELQIISLRQRSMGKFR